MACGRGLYSKLRIGGLSTTLDTPDYSLDLIVINRWILLDLV